MPPEELNIELMNGRPSLSRPCTWIVQTAPDPSARTRSGTMWEKAFRIGNGTYMPTTCRALTGTGYSALTIQLLGSLILIGARLPALLARSGFRILRTAKLL